ncbi:hypothetical protein [Palleronia sp. THAF1]|uniref:hypothetical protein n=1 Tax=Palleronia sp. THAF1 TaxID=2587842 RepID=UPI000F542561|nr:hypothetical protein [Palleronia sp. THAF1]
MDAAVEVVGYLGADSFLILGTEEAGKITLRADGNTSAMVGDKIGLALSGKLHAFTESRAAIS